MDWPTKADMEMGNHGHGRGTYSRPKNVRTKNSNKGAKNENRWYRTSSALPLPLSLIVNVIIATVWLSVVACGKQRTWKLGWFRSAPTAHDSVVFVFKKKWKHAEKERVSRLKRLSQRKRELHESLNKQTWWWCWPKYQSGYGYCDFAPVRPARGFWTSRCFNFDKNLRGKKRTNFLFLASCQCRHSFYNFFYLMHTQHSYLLGIVLFLIHLTTCNLYLFMIRLCSFTPNKNVKKC